MSKSIVSLSGAAGATAPAERANIWAARALDYLPDIGLAVLILIGGILVAWAARSGARRLASYGNRLLDRVFRRGAMSGARLSRGASAVIGEIAFWVVIVVAAAFAVQVARLPGLAAWLGQIVAWLPSLLLGAAVIAVGHFVGVRVGEQIASAARDADSQQSVLLGRLAQSAIFVTALIIGLDQIGVEINFLIAIFAVAGGAVCFGFSVAFGLGARDFVGNLISARNMRRDLQPGQTVRIDDIEGEVLEITPTRVALETREGRALIPARRLEQSVVVVLAREEGGEPHG